MLESFYLNTIFWGELSDFASLINFDYTAYAKIWLPQRSKVCVAKILEHNCEIISVKVTIVLESALVESQMAFVIFGY